MNRSQSMRTYYLAHRNFLEVFRDPLMFILGAGLPIGLLLLFTAIGRSAPIDIFKPVQMTPAIVIFSYSFLIMFSGMLLTRDRKSAFFSRLLTAPLRSSDFIAAYLLPFVPLAALQTAAGVIAGVAAGFRPGAGMLPALLVFFLMAVFNTAVGLILGLLFNENQIAGIGSLLINVAGILGGAWMDLDLVGGTIRTVGYLLPFANAVDLVRDQSAGWRIFSSGEFLVVALWSIAALLLSVLLFRRATRR